jgi:hypothetical protein
VRKGQTDDSMFEFHGWATIRESARDTDAGRLSAIIERINRRISEYSWHSGVLGLHVINGAYQLVTTGFTNHRDTRAAEITALYSEIAQIAPGSYGLLYMRNDEDPDPLRRNGFEVWVLARGALDVQSDGLLSPFVPTVEDPPPGLDRVR